jgi:hypothetical protein
MAEVTVAFRGIFWEAGTDGPQARGPDPWYLVSTVWAQQADGGVRAKTTKLPGDRPVFDDIGTGESHRADITLYTGAAASVVVGTHVFEEGFGDPVVAKQQIAGWARSIEELAVTRSDFRLPDAVEEGAAALIASRLGFGDDEVDRFQTRLFTESMLAGLATSPARQEHGIRYRFRTWHPRPGSCVVAYYDVLAG